MERGDSIGRDDPPDGGLETGRARPPWRADFPAGWRQCMRGIGIVILAGTNRPGAAAQPYLVNGRARPPWRADFPAGWRQCMCGIGIVILAGTNRPGAAAQPYLFGGRARRPSPTI
jgi:hypothetical protein